MSGRSPELPAAFEAIAEALDEPAGRVTFLRGLMLGTLVGAAIVGSVLRARQTRRAPPLPASRGPDVTVPEGGTPAGHPTAEVLVVRAEPTGDGGPEPSVGPAS